MSSFRAMRSVSQALQTSSRAWARPTTARLLSTQIAKPVIASQSKTQHANKTPAKRSITGQLPEYSKLTVLTAAMPQLVPFYFVNEVVVTFAVLPILIYVFSKYLLPQKVRTMAARLFVSKL